MSESSTPSHETTLCWHCSKDYPMAAEKCPHCRSINANVDPDGAYEDYLFHHGRIGEPGNLDI